VRLRVVGGPDATTAGEESPAPTAAAPSKRAFLLAAGPWRDLCPYSPRERLLWTGCGMSSGGTSTPRTSGRWRRARATGAWSPAAGHAPPAAHGAARPP